MKIERGDHKNLSVILSNLRDEDRQELAACGRNFDTDARVQSYLALFFVCHPLVFVGTVEGAAVAAWGAVPVWPGVAAAFAFGTRDWGKVIAPMTRHIRSVVVPQMVGAGYHRVEARALANRQDIARWMKLLGARPEATLKQMGTRREDFAIYVWLKDEIEAAIFGHSVPYRQVA